MSFSADVKEELSKQLNSSRHCQIAEIAAIIQYGGKIKKECDGQSSICLQTENLFVARKFFTLLRKTFNIDTDITEVGYSEPVSHVSYMVQVGNMEADSVLQAIKQTDAEDIARKNLVSPLLIKSTCCRRAFLRGAYLTIGSMSNPAKSYHLEFVCINEEQAEQLRDIIHGFEIEAKIIIRKKYYVVYVKEGSGIVELLNVIEAHVSLMDLENTRIVKEMRNSINRRVNCEAANITKTVNAATKQLEDIEYIKERYGLNRIPDNLREMAEVRLEHPDATLNELGKYLNPPVGKSGVNHRLRKLSELAEEMRL